MKVTRIILVLGLCGIASTSHAFASRLGKPFISRFASSVRAKALHPKFILGSGLFSSYAYQQKLADEANQNQTNSKELEDKIEFDRDNFVYVKHEGFCEGHWASDINPEEDSYRGIFPFPKAYKEPWIGKDEFLKKLYQIEASAGKSDSVIQVIHCKGMSPSRLKPNCSVSNKTYVDSQKKINWPDGYSWHYIKEFNVKPSREFFRYAMEFPLNNQTQPK